MSSLSLTAHCDGGSYAHRLDELGLAQHDAAKWEWLLRATAAPVGRMRVALASRGAKVIAS